MGLPPTGEIVARPMLRRICGCVCEFQHYKVDKYRAQRQAKFLRTRCPECASKLVAEKSEAPQIPKAEALKQLPPGTQVSLTLGGDGNWSGKLTADGDSVEAKGPAGAGVQAVVVALARLWVTAREDEA